MWSRFLAYLGGLIGGAALMIVPLAGTPLSFLTDTLDVVGALAVIVFAVAFIVHGISELVRSLTS